jgi:hypothetical protein
LEAGVAVVEGEAAVQRLVDLCLGTGEAEAAGLLRDLEAAAVPLHDVVVADVAFMNEAANVVDIFRGRAPGCGGFTRRAGEAAVVVGDEFAQHAVGGAEILSACQAEFAAEAIPAARPRGVRRGLWPADCWRR